MKHFKRFYPTTVLIAFTILNIWGVFQVLKIRPSSSLEQFQPKNHPLLDIDKSVKSRFQIYQVPTLVVLFKSEGNGWFAPKPLKELQNISKEIKKMPQVIGVQSIANIPTPVTENGTFTISPVNEMNVTPKLKKQILNNPLIAPHFLSKDGKYAAMIVKTKNISFTEQAALITEVESLISKKPSMYQAQVAGTTAISAQMTKLLSKEFVLFTGLSFIISVLILLLIFNSWLTAAVSLGIVVTANIQTLAVMYVFNLPLTPLSSTVPTLVTLTVVVVLAQTLARLGEFKDETLREVMIWRTLKERSFTHILATLTTSIGFGTLMFSEIGIIKDYGLSVAICAMVACFVTLLLFAALYMWLPIPEKRKWPFSPAYIAQKTLDYRKAICVSIIGVCLICAAGGARLNWSFMLLDDLPPENSTRQATQTVEAHMGGAIPLEISIGAEKGKSPWKDPKNLKKLSQLTHKWSKNPNVGSVMALSDFVKVAHPERKLASTSKAVAETLFVYAMASENPLDYFLTSNEKYTRIALRMKDIPSLQMQELVENFKKEAKDYFPKMTVESAGLAATSHPLQFGVAHALVFDFYIALIFISVLLFFFFGPISFIGAIPNLVPPALLLGLLSFTNTPIKPGIAIVFSISLGMAFNNTVYILSTMKRFQKEKPDWTLFDLMCEELGPCFIATLAVTSGFVVFMLSSFSMNRVFGSFMVISLASGLLGDLVLFPALLSLFPRFLQPPKNGEKMLVAKERVKKMFKRSKTPDISAAALFVLCFIPFFVAERAHAVTVEEIMDKMKNAGRSPSEQVTMKMTTKESDGSTKVRTMVIKRKNGKEQKALVKILSPSDLKGVGLLTTVSASKEQSQYLFLPSEKRARRVVSSNKKGRFLDSELTFEDMNISTYENFNNKVKEEKNEGGKKITVIESIAKDKDGDSSYGKIITWLEGDNFRIQKADYYDTEGKLLKTIAFKNYKERSKMWRPELVVVNNVQKNRSTTLKLEKLSTKKLDDSDFSMSALEEH